MNRTFFHCTSSRSASLARRSRSDVWRAISGRSSASSTRRSSPEPWRDSRSDAMDDEIRIPADGRREVRIGVGRQPEVAEVGRVVSRLLHRPQHQERDRLFLRLAAHFLHQALEVARRDLSAAPLSE